ncbi:MAG: hypothetical protein MUC36_22115 [Planctomycetes bacterium]|jgi:hypothetical protein|nr:hypothetical protein [Planctomycetota bacterium]
MKRAVVSIWLCVAACGGGGGGGAVLPSAPTRLLATDLELGPTVNQGDVVVRLSSVPDPAPVLLQVAIEIPPQLSLPAGGERLLAAAPLVDLDGDFVDGRFVVMCGDARNANAVPLAVGDLFRLRLQPSLPRQPGTYTVRLRQVLAASRDGAAVAAETETISATVTVR